MSFNNASPDDPPVSAANRNLEAQLRGMILSNNQAEIHHGPAPAKRPGSLGLAHHNQQAQPVLLFGTPGHTTGHVIGFSQPPHPTTSSLPPINSNLFPGTQGLPPPGYLFPAGDSTAPYQTYRGPPPGLQSQPQTGLQYSPSQQLIPPPHPNMSPNTSPRHDYIPPHMQNIYRQQPPSPKNSSPPVRQRPQPPQMMPLQDQQPQTPPSGRRPHNPRNTSRAPEHNHFPPLGIQPAKTNFPSPDSYQQPTQRPHQHTQYQPLPINTRTDSPARGGRLVRGNFRSANYAGRLPQQAIEQISTEQSHNLNNFSKRIIAEAAPPASETSIKHALLKRLEFICKEVSPDAKLIPFGSFVTGFATANSDLDVIFTRGSHSGESLDDLTSPDFRIPLLLESKLQDEGFNATLLTKTRVPILKLVQNATKENPFELHCDIGFSNHLAVFNTNMLSTYSKCDSRVKEIMIFIKWWAKKRHINNPYRGTLSSYGYSLIVLHYLINIVKPPVLPNLQTFPVSEDTTTAEIVFEEATGNDIFEIWFFKDTNALPKSGNTMHTGELLRGFFEYYAYGFQWGREVVSIRTTGGLLTKQEKGWVTAVVRPGKVENSEVKDRYLFAVEDPFEVEHNVSRTCNGPGVGRIKEEFRRAVRLIRYRDGGRAMSECLCMEAPPERPWVRREDRDKAVQGRGGDGRGAEHNEDEREKREGEGTGEGNRERISDGSAKV